MSLIPIMLGRLSSAPIPEIAGTTRYDPGAGPRPIAAVVAVGLPVALLVAVALSPFEMPVLPEPKSYPPILSLPKPPPPDPEPVDQPQQRESKPTTAPSPFPPTPEAPVFDPPIDRPIPRGPTVGEDPPIAKDPPPVPLFIEAKLDPRYARTFQPDYPPYEQRNEIEGTARVSVLVGTDGRVKAVEDVASTRPGFFTETRRRATAKWRFKPATRGGTAEDSWVVITVRFRLDR